MNLSIQLGQAQQAVYAGIEQSATRHLQGIREEAQKVRDYFAVQVGWQMRSIGQIRRWNSADRHLERKA